MQVHAVGLLLGWLTGIVQCSSGRSEARLSVAAVSAGWGRVFRGLGAGESGPVSG